MNDFGHSEDERGNPDTISTFTQISVHPTLKAIFSNTILNKRLSIVIWLKDVS